MRCRCPGLPHARLPTPPTCRRRLLAAATPSVLADWLAACRLLTCTAGRPLACLRQVLLSDRRKLRCPVQINPQFYPISVQLAAEWQRSGEVLDGDVLWTADEAHLRRLGCSATVAHRIMKAVQEAKAAAAATQVGACPLPRVCCFGERCRLALAWLPAACSLRFSLYL